MKKPELAPRSKRRPSLVVAMLRDAQLWAPLIALGVGLLVLEWVR